jgi:quinoprotein glucose dehydrogenase
MALNSSDGHLLWETNLVPELRDGNYQVTSAPVVSGNTVIVGSAIGDNGRAEMERGTVRAYDARTGKPKWTWDPTPAGRTGAANAWAPMTVDEKNDLVLIPTGSASPDFFGGMRPGDNVYANSVVALTASTGKLRWSFQSCITISGTTTSLRAGSDRGPRQACRRCPHQDRALLCARSLHRQAIASRGGAARGPFHHRR